MDLYSAFSMRQILAGLDLHCPDSKHAVKRWRWRSNAFLVQADHSRQGLQSHAKSVRSEYRTRSKDLLGKSTISICAEVGSSNHFLITLKLCLLYAGCDLRATSRSAFNFAFTAGVKKSFNGRKASVVVMAVYIPVLLCKYSSNCCWAILGSASSS